MDVRLDYISVGVNRVVNALAWGEHGGVAYAAHHMVALYDVESAKVVSTICGHTGAVNCVLWVPHEATPELRPCEHLLLSGSADNTVRCWLVTYPEAAGPAGGAAAPSWRQLAVLQGHAGPVSSLAVHRLPTCSTPAQADQAADQGPRLLVVSTAGGEDVMVWACGDSGTSGDAAGDGQGGASAEPCSSDGAADGHASTPQQGTAAEEQYGQSQWRVDQRIHVGTKMQTTAAMASLPLDPDWTLLATGGTDRKVALYVRPPGGCFSSACVLEGHENWVRGVAFCCVVGPSGPQLLLASVSQDRYGRIWKLQPEPLDATAAATDAGAENPLAALIQRYAPRPHVATDRTRYVATAEALLIGHEDWVHGLQWAPRPQPQPGTPPGGPTYHTRSSAALLTASMDRTMIIWRFEAASGLWMNEASLGDAGASCLGYFGGVWGPGGRGILAHGFTGALHLWRHPAAHAGSSDGAPAWGSGPWLPRHALGGHFGPVVDLGWGLDGGCVISVSEDQTARVHTAAVWRRRQEQEEERQEGGTVELSGTERELHWCEVARAQVHGHDFRCVAPVATAPGCHYTYVSGSEEKVLRVLEAPQAFIDTLVQLRGGEDSPGGRAIREERRRGHGFGAAVAALGLSQKAVDQADAAEGGGGSGGAGSGGAGADYTDGPDFVPFAAPQVVSEPPLEEHLAQNTLWPETHKLYGHGNDVFCAAASPDGRYLASACKAQTAATAAIWVWCTRTWRAVAQLRAHSLTVTQLEWSPSSNLLAAASRDRTFSIFRRRDPLPAAAPEGGGGGAAAAAMESSFELVCRVKSAHGRVIWSASWSLDEQLLATASRDETVKVWRTGSACGSSSSGGADAAATAAAPALAVTLPQFPCGVTAVAFAPRPPSSATVGTLEAAVAASTDGGKDGESTDGLSYVLAVGLEDGAVQVWRMTAAAEAAAADGTPALVPYCLWSAGQPWRHVAPVRRLRWRGAPGTAIAVPEGEDAAAAAVSERGALQLASGSEDHSVRVFTVGAT